MESSNPVGRTQSIVESIPGASGALTDYPFNEDDMIIAVMGATGCGKSSFINLAAKRANAVIGHNLESCTQNVQAYSCLHPNGSGRNVIFVDTPGFDDTNRLDTDILIAISDWLTTTYKVKVRLSGLLFLHRISDNRMTGTPLRNLSRFQELCGTSTLQNVILATTMWDDIDQTLGSYREAELRTKYWKSMINAGSRMARFECTYEFAWEIIAKFTGRVLQLQVEMADQGMALNETSAGSVLLSWLEKTIARLQRAIHICSAHLRGIPKDNSALLEDLAAKREAIQFDEQKRILGNKRERYLCWGFFVVTIRRVITSIVGWVKEIFRNDADPLQSL